MEKLQRFFNLNSICLALAIIFLGSQGSLVWAESNVDDKNFSKNNSNHFSLADFPEDISGVWENTTLVPAYEPEGHVQRESTYKLVLEQNENRIVGTFLTRIFMRAGIVQKHIRLEGTYDDGRIHLETTGLIRENCFAPENVSALYDLTFFGEVRYEGDKVVFDAKYDFASYRTFQFFGNQMVLANGNDGLKGPIEIYVIRTRVTISEEERFEITGEKVEEEVIEDITTIDNILFKQSTTELLAETDSLEVIKLADMLIKNPAWTVVLEGYTENRGSWKENLALSKARSELVRQHLIEWKKINPDRIVTEGYGPHKPVATNAVENYRKMNRRVEVIIKKEGTSQ